MLNEQEQNNYNPEIGLEIIENQIVTQEEVIVSEVTTIIENVEPTVNEEITEVLNVNPTNIKKTGNSIKKAFNVK